VTIKVGASMSEEATDIDDRWSSYKSSSRKESELPWRSKEKCSQAELELQATKKKLEDLRVLRYEETHDLKKRVENLENEISRKEKTYEEYRQQVKVHEEARDKLRVELNEANQKAKEIDQLLHASKKEQNEVQAKLDEEKIERSSLSKQYDELRVAYSTNEREKFELQSKVKSYEDLIFKNETVKEALEQDLQEVKEMLHEAEQSKFKLLKELDEHAKQTNILIAEQSQYKKSLAQAKEKAAKDDGTKSELRKEIFELKQVMTTLRSDKEQLKADMNTEIRRFL